MIRLFDTDTARLLHAVGAEPVEELRHGAILTEVGVIVGESRLRPAPADLSAVLERALTYLGRLPRVGDRIEVDLEAEFGPPGRAEIEVLAVRRRVARRVVLRTAAIHRSEPMERSWMP